MVGSTINSPIRTREDRFGRSAVGGKFYIPEPQLPFELQSPTHRLECLRIVEEIVDNLDDKAIMELTNGMNDEDVVSQVINTMLVQTYKALYTGDAEVDFSPKYTERLSQAIEETLRCANLTYFITSVMPDFQLSWHHLEWGDLITHHKKLCIEAARDHGKCLSLDTPVLLYNGQIKKASEIRLGDTLMGVDSTPRLVTSLHRGRDEHMYKYHQSKGDDFVTNSQHIQTFIHVGRGKRLEVRPKHIVDIGTPELLTYSKNYIYEHLRTFKVSWEMPERKVLIDPYFLGIWLGDGYSHKTVICKPYKAIADYCDEYAKKIGINCDHEDWNEKMGSYANHILYEGYLGGPKHQRNIKHSKLYVYLKAYRLLNNKHIPEQYLYNSRRVRMQLLAGLLDTDGDNWCNGMHYGSINKHLVEQVRYLSNSLGFKTSKVLGGKKFNKQLGRMYEYWGIDISGKIDQIPLRLTHKHQEYDWTTKQSNKDWGTIDGITPSVVSSFTVEDVGPGEYVSITTDGDHRFLLGDGTVTHNSYYFSNAYLAWQLYRYKKPTQAQFSARPTTANSNRGFLFSFSLQQAVDLIEILKNTIEGNDILKERLMPENKAEGAWASTNIVCKNGARLTGKGFGSSVRGAHPYYIVVDDGLKDNVIYSSMQRQKSIDYFHSVIMNMLVPKGQIIVVGTPFHAQDLYGDLKTKRGWFCIEYPAIFPNGRILWPQRWSFEDLMEKKESQGNIIFSRENLCRPIISDSSIFPIDILNRSLNRMQTYTLVANRDDFPKKFSRVVTGCDFAISGRVGSDYYCFSTFGIDDYDNSMWLLNLQLGKGKSYEEQKQMLRGINVKFSPDVMVFESNVFQMIYTTEASKEGLPVVPHNTGVEKNDLQKGWPGLAIMFEQGKFHIPIGDKYSQDMKDQIFDQLGSIAFTDEGLCSVGSHDDIGSSFWLASLGRNISVTGFKFGFL